MNFAERLNYVNVIQLPADEGLARRNAALLAEAITYLRDRHVLVRDLRSPGDYWYGSGRHERD